MCNILHKGFVDVTQFSFYLFAEGLHDQIGHLKGKNHRVHFCQSIIVYLQTFTDAAIILMIYFRTVSPISLMCYSEIHISHYVTNQYCVLWKVSRKNAAVLMDFVQMRGGAPCPNFLPSFHKCIFGQ